MENEMGEKNAKAYMRGVNFAREDFENGEADIDAMREKADGYLDNYDTLTSEDCAFWTGYKEGLEEIEEDEEDLWEAPR